MQVAVGSRECRWVHLSGPLQGYGVVVIEIVQPKNTCGSPQGSDWLQ